MKCVVLIFDIPRGQNRVKVKVWRDLKKMKARKHQHSVWKHSDLDKLVEIAMFIKNNGDRATILEERFLF